MKGWGGKEVSGGSPPSHSSCPLESSKICRHRRTQGILAAVILHTHKHTRTHTFSLICPITLLPAPVFHFILSSCVLKSFFSSAHDALWHNETVKRSPVQRLELRTRRGGGGDGGGGCVKWHHTRALYLQRASLTQRLFIAARSLLSFCRTLLHRHKHRHQMALLDLRCAASAKGDTPYPLACSCTNPTSPRSSSPTTHSHTHLLDIRSLPLWMFSHLSFLISYRFLFSILKKEKRDFFLEGFKCG